MNTTYRTTVKRDGTSQTHGIDWGNPGLRLHAINVYTGAIVWLWGGGSVWSGRGMPRSYKATAYIVGQIIELRTTESTIEIKWERLTEFDQRRDDTIDKDIAIIIDKALNRTYPKEG